jgi:hypothetical protein
VLSRFDAEGGELGRSREVIVGSAQKEGEEEWRESADPECLTYRSGQNEFNTRLA